jgi:hypothetical protein
LVLRAISVADVSVVLVGLVRAQQQPPERSLLSLRAIEGRAFSRAQGARVSPV